MEETSNNVANGFPHKKMQRITGAPNYQTIYDLHQKLNANAASIPTTLEGGSNGHLGLTLSDNRYHQETGHHYVAPNHPGPAPIIAQGTTALAERNERGTYMSQLRGFNQHSNVSNALKQNIVEAVDEIYLDGVKNTLTGFLNVTPYEMLQHLYRTKGKITTR